MFEYFMVQVPPNVNATASNKDIAAATYLANIVGQYAQQGWEFYSIETIGVIEHPGCGCLTILLLPFFGYQTNHREVYVIVFRRTKTPSGPTSNPTAVQAPPRA